VAANVRWGQPDGVLELYQMGSEGAQWWTEFPDVARGQPTKGIFTRCSTSGTCPKVIEHFGGAEVFALKMTMSWVGTGADTDIPLTRNVRRYYIPSTTHGGGAGGFVHLPAATGASCPGNNYGIGNFRANPMPSTQMVNVIRLAMRNWVLNGTPPPPSRYPTLIGGNLVNPTKAAMGFPSGVPGVPDSIFDPENFIFPVFDYDWGPSYNGSDATGFATNLPPPIKSVIPMKVPRVDADGNELGGVPTVLRDAPLGTYLGWNIAAAGFYKGQVCNYVGGYIPFALTQAERLASGDTRLSLTERYGDHAGYVTAVTNAANNAFAQGYLLAVDRDALIAAAAASSVLVPPPAAASEREKRGN
jgi:Alpha/beta hydrolase domain